VHLNRHELHRTSPVAGSFAKAIAAVYVHLSPRFSWPAYAKGWSIVSLPLSATNQSFKILPFLRYCSNAVRQKIWAYTFAVTTGVTESGSIEEDVASGKRILIQHIALTPRATAR